MRSAKEQLKMEVIALREAKAINQAKMDIGHTAHVDAEEELFKDEYPDYMHYLSWEVEDIERQIQRLERDLKMLETGNIFADIQDDEEV